MKKLRKDILRLTAVLCAVAIIIAMFPVSIPVSAAKSDDATIIVSLGDSFASGESVERFYGQELPLSQKVKNEDWLAHRSENSWSGMLTLSSVEGPMSQHRNENWYFVAVSGATTADICKTPGWLKALPVDYYAQNSKKAKDDGIMVKEYHKKWMIETPSGINALPAHLTAYRGKKTVSFQLDIFDELKKKSQEVDYVTISIGGNDAGFADIVMKMATGSVQSYLDWQGLKKTAENVKKEMQSGGKLYNNIKNAYKRVAEAAGPQATIIVAGYPKLFDPDGSKVFITKEEAELVNKATSDFNNALKSIVDTCKSEGMDINFVSVESAFETHGAYSKDPFINEIMLGAKEEDINDLSISSAYSVHPNAKGVDTYRRRVQNAISNDFSRFPIAGTVFEVKEENGIETRVPIRKAIVTVYSHDLEKVVETVQMAYTSGEFFEVYLPVGNYSVTVEAEGYVSSTTSFEFRSADLYLPIPLSPARKTESHESVTSINCYLPVIEKAIVETAYDNATGSGFLYDIDSDGVDELVILNVYAEVGGNIPRHAYSIYDIENGEVKAKCDKEVLFYDAGGPSGYVGVVNYLGSTALVVYIDNGETGYQAHRESLYTIYNPDNLQVIASASLDYVSADTVQVNNCIVNGNPCSYNDYLSIVDAIEPIMIADIYSNDGTDGSMGLYELLRFIQKLSGIKPEQSPKITKTDAGQIANLVWGEYLKREQGFDWKIFEEESLIKKGVEYYCYTLQTNSKYGATNWSVVYYLFINSVTGEYSNSLYDGFSQVNSTDPPETEQVESTPEIGSDTITEQELLGEWVIDTEYTMEFNDMSMWDFYGTSFSDGGNKMAFSSDGSYKYYVAWCYGNGTFELQNGEIAVNLTDGDPIQGAIKLFVMTDGATRIALDQYGDGNLIFWIKS